MKNDNIPNRPIEPILKSITVDLNAETAFNLLTQKVTEWWPLATHSVSLSECGTPALSCAFEPYIGGRFYEVMANSDEKEWGRILDWQLAKRIVFSWHVGVDQSQASEVEFSFDEHNDTKTSINLEHRNWHPIGKDAQTHRDRYDSGWITVFEMPFSRLASAHVVKNLRRPYHGTI